MKEALELLKRELPEIDPNQILSPEDRSDFSEAAIQSVGTILGQMWFWCNCSQEISATLVYGDEVFELSFRPKRMKAILDVDSEVGQG